MYRNVTDTRNKHLNLNLKCVCDKDPEKLVCSLDDKC